MRIFLGQFWDSFWDSLGITANGGGCASVPAESSAGLLLPHLNYDTIPGMKDATTVKHDNRRSALPPFFASQDGELAIKAMRGIADIEAGRCAPVAEVRERLLSRYEPSRACV